MDIKKQSNAELEIESLLFKQVKKPKDFLSIKIINVFGSKYRINIYTENYEDGLIKKHIKESYFCHYDPGKLLIIKDKDKEKRTNNERQR